MMVAKKDMETVQPDRLVPPHVSPSKLLRHFSKGSPPKVPLQKSPLLHLLPSAKFTTTTTTTTSATTAPSRRRTCSSSSSFPPHQPLQPLRPNSIHHPRSYPPPPSQLPLAIILTSTSHLTHSLSSSPSFPPPTRPDQASTSPSTKFRFFSSISRLSTSNYSSFNAHITNLRPHYQACAFRFTHLTPFN